MSTKAEKYRKYKQDNPYHVWAYRDDGTKFVAHFKNKRDATRWAGAVKSRIGKETNASYVRMNTKPKKKSSNPYMGYLPKGFKVRF